MKLCVDCKHYREGRYSDLCTSPHLGISPVTGKVKVQEAVEQRSRRPDNPCGIEAKYFEPKPEKKPPKTFWEKWRPW